MIDAHFFGGISLVPHQRIGRDDVGGCTAQACQTINGSLERGIDIVAGWPGISFFAGSSDRQLTVAAVFLVTVFELAVAIGVFTDDQVETAFISGDFQIPNRVAAGADAGRLVMDFTPFAIGIDG